MVFSQGRLVASPRRPLLVCFCRRGCKDTGFSLHLLSRMRVPLRHRESVHPVSLSLRPCRDRLRTQPPLWTCQEVCSWNDEDCSGTGRCVSLGSSLDDCAMVQGRVLREAWDVPTVRRGRRGVPRPTRSVRRGTTGRSPPRYHRTKGPTEARRGSPVTTGEEGCLCPPRISPRRTLPGFPKGPLVRGQCLSSVSSTPPALLLERGYPRTLDTASGASTGPDPSSTVPVARTGRDLPWSHPRRGRGVQITCRRVGRNLRTLGSVDSVDLV